MSKVLKKKIYYKEKLVEKGSVLTKSKERLTTITIPIICYICTFSSLLNSLVYEKNHFTPYTYVAVFNMYHLGLNSISILHY